MSKYPNRKYVIIPTSKVEDIDFNQIKEKDAKSLRISEDGEYTFVKFEGDTTPDFLNGFTQYTHTEIIAILNPRIQEFNNLMGQFAGVTDVEDKQLRISGKGGKGKPGVHNAKTARKSNLKKVTAAQHNKLHPEKGRKAAAARNKTRRKK